MENENQNTITPQAGSPTGDMQAYVSAMRRKRNRNILIGMLVAVCLGVVGYFSYKNPQLFKAEIELVPGVPSGTQQLYIPSYTAGVGDEGTISIKSNATFTQQFNVIGFTLKYTPTSALSFESDPFVLTDTKMASANLRLADNSQAGKLSILLAMPTATTSVVPGDVIFSLGIQINPTIASGQEIQFTVEDLQVYNGTTQLTAVNTMGVGTITVGGGNKLRVLNAESTDSTHVTVRFSDFLTNFANYNYYKVYVNNNGTLGAPLAVTGAELGSDSTSVNLVTASQAPGTSYVVVATGDVIESNTQGKLNSNYDTALFYGYGQSGLSLSNFNMVSAVATDYKTVVVTFTDNVKASSVTAADFILADMTNIAATQLITVSGAAVSGKTVTLTVAGSAPCSTYSSGSSTCAAVTGCNWSSSDCNGTPADLGLMLKKKTYGVRTVGIDSVLRDSDSAPLGVSTVAFSGKDNGPILQGATVTSSGGDTPEYTLQLAFAPSTDTIAYGGVSGNPIGHLYVNDAITSGTLINESSGYNQTISANKITLKNPVFGDSTKLFTFTLSDNSYIKNSLGLPSDESFKTISFWGYSHVENNTIGDIAVVNKKTIQVTAGSLAFSGVTSNSQISVVYENPSGSSLVEQTVSSFNVDGSGKLNIVFASNLKSNTSYVLRLKETGAIVTSKRFYLDQSLSVTSATATANNKISVAFSEGVDENTVQKSDFTIGTIYGTPVLLSSMEIASDYQHIILTTTLALDPATVYGVMASSDPTDPIYAYSGKALGKSIAIFSGYGTLAAPSTVTVQNAESLSGTTVRLNFSGALNVTTATSPVNLKLVNAEAFICPQQNVTAGASCTPASVTPSTMNYISGSSYCTCPDVTDPDIWVCTAISPTCLNTLALSPLTITNIVNTTGNTYELTTSQQVAGKNYFVVMNGVKDSGGLLLGNAKVLNFFGFELAAPKITSISPTSITNDIDQTVTITGTNLAAVETVKVGSEEVEIGPDQSATSITITIPAGFDAKPYSITLIDTEGMPKTFANMLFVNEPVLETYIESLATPPGVKNDGEMSTSLHVCIHGPDLANITSVLVNLTQIGGISAQVMTKDTIPQNANTQCYTYVVASVPSTVDTSDTAYLLPVEAHRGTEIITGTVPVLVTNDILGSVPPVIMSAHVVPPSLAPNGEATAKISAQVKDMDGADSIASVVADMGDLGTPLVLSAIEAGTGAELTTRYYQSEEFTVPTNTAVGAYTINLTASDLTGESVTQALTLNVSTALTGPTISTTRSYITRKSIPNDGKTEFAIYAHVTDPDGVADLTNVTASFGDIGIAPVTLIKDPNAADTAKSAFFSATGLKIPKTTPLGVKSIEVTAEDSTGGLANYIIQVDVTSRDLLGEAPMIIEDRGYTTPKVAINDGSTPITLYVFVRDDDDNLESVVANLSTIGQVGPETPVSFDESGSSGTVLESAGGEGCSTGSNTMVCMTPSFKEGNAGQWFTLSGVTISKDTAPSSEPYIIDIIATDATGGVAHGQLSVSVNNGESFTNDKLPPKILAAVPTATNKVEVLFNEEIDATSVSASGAEFTITDKNDINQKLGIVSATINSSGTIVTLTTDTQTAGKEYALSGTSDITDAVGVSLVAGSSNRKLFNGFQAKGKVPVVDYVTAMDLNTVEVEFHDLIKPSSIKLSATTGSDVNFEIFTADTNEKLPIVGVTFGDKPTVIEVKTEIQNPNQGYRIQIKGVESFDGKKPDAGLSKSFKAINLRAVQHQAAGNIGDFDGNGSVDFSDFTIFSSVYGMSYYQTAGAGAEAAPETGGQPLTPVPDATVPVTSEPAGGDLPVE
jgi:hypothetical protein